MSTETHPTLVWPNDFEGLLIIEVSRGTAALSQSRIWIVVVEISRCNAALLGFVGAEISRCKAFGLI